MCCELGLCADREAKGRKIGSKDVENIIHVFSWYVHSYLTFLAHAILFTFPQPLSPSIHIQQEFNELLEHDFVFSLFHEVICTSDGLKQENEKCVKLFKPIGCCTSTSLHVHSITPRSLFRVAHIYTHCTKHHFLLYFVSQCVGEW